MPRGGDRDKGHRQQHQGGEYAGAGGGGDVDDKRKPRRNFYKSDKNRGPPRYYGKNRNYNSGGDRGDRRNFKRARFDVGERLKEVDLGITEYVAGDIEGFTGTIKERFTDFMVHEVSLTGEIAKLTNQDIPPDPEENIDIEELKKKVPEDVWDKLQKITDNSDVEIDVTDMDKDQRKCIHQIVKKMTTVYSETKDMGDKKLMVFSKEYSNQYGNRRDNRKDWSARGGDYCHFILHKFNMDTMDALNQLSRVLHLKPSIFSYAGTKDRRAKTSQWISVKKMNPKNIKNAAYQIRGAFVGNFKFEKAPLKLGKLYGNRFTIALRNVTTTDDHIEKAMVSLRDKGFINYYGLQRFGTIAAIPTHEIGKALLQGNWTEAVDLILKPREGEQDHNLAEAREVYQKTKDARQAYQKLGRTDKLEAKLLWGLNICGQSNLQGALDMVPRNTMLMYIHAYQSKMWNEIVSRRIKEFGLKPIAGDLVYENPDAKDDFIIDDSLHHEVEDADKSTSDEKAVDNAAGSEDEKVVKPIEDSVKIKEETNTEDKKTEEKKDEETKDDIKKEDDKESEKDDGERRLPKVKVLTEEDLSKYTMEDVVMPQPGWKVVYPPYAKDWFDEQLQKDNLTPELKQKNKKYTLSGSYRKVLEIPKNLNWKIIHYNNKNDDLLLSDVDELRDIEPLKDDPEGKFKALIIQMSLKSSTYATMALREALKCDTSSQTHAAQSAAFHEAHEKQEAQKREEDKLNAETSEAESIPNVENLELKDHSSDEPSQSTEDEASDKKSSVSISNSTMLEDSIIEEEASNALKSDKKSTSSMLEDSTTEDKLQKHASDPTNDSGIEPGTVIHA